MAKKKPRTEAELRQRGYVTAYEAATALRNDADHLAQGSDWVKFSLTVWYTEAPVDAND